MGASMRLCEGPFVQGDGPGQHPRCVSDPSMSTGGLLLMLVRWAFASKRMGGFECEKQRQAAREFLEALLGEAPLVLWRCAASGMSEKSIRHGARQRTC